MVSLICRVCLAGDVRMHSIGEDLGLQEIYEKVTSTKLYTEDRRPVTICYICCSQLQKCNRFAKMSQRAENVLTELVDNGLEMMQLNLPIIPNLVVTTTTLISLDRYSESESAPRAVKEEFSEAEECDLNGFETVEMLDIESFKTKEGSVIDSDYCHPYYDVSNEVFTLKGSMVTHFQSNSEEKSLSTTSSSKIHEDVNTQRSFICDHCDKAFSKKPYLKVHMKVHYRSKSYVCKQCSSSFTSFNDLLKHSKIHKRPMKYICNICGKIFLQRHSLIKHIRIHTGEKPYACKKCHMTFNQSSTLQRHEKIHTKPSSFKCQQCNKQFSQYRTLQTHFKNCIGVSCTTEIETMTEPTRSNITRKNVKHNVCNICSKILSSKLALKSHYTKQHFIKLKPYACKFCIDAFETRAELTEHIQTHGKQLYTCDYCNISVCTKRNIHNHIMNVHFIPRSAQKKKYVCHICGKAFVSADEMRNHIRVHTGEKPYPCDYCNKTFSTKSYRSKHRKIHTGEKPYPCDYCNKTFNSKFNRKIHRKIHTGEKQHVCKTCDKAYANFSSLKVHMEKHSANPYVCKICGKTYLRNDCFKVHLITHSGIKRFTCDSCHKSYFFKSQLKSHILRVHSKERPFSCSKCNKSYSLRCQLNQHLRKHNGVYYTCNVCNKKFPYPDSLKVHMFVHTGLSPYACVQCDRSFANTCNLKAHNKVHHPELLSKNKS